MNTAGKTSCPPAAVMETAMENSLATKAPAPLLNELWEELLIERERCWSRVISSSMYPLIRRGDQVLVEGAGPENIRFGDIAVFKRNGKLIVHRVLGKTRSNGRGHFLEKGDANLSYSLVPTEKVIGRVTVISNPGKDYPTLSGTGRCLQLALACLSYFSLRLWAGLQPILPGRGQTIRRLRYGARYRRVVIFLYRIALRLFK